MFKYYRISDYITAEKLLGNNPSIRFSSPSELNDPFELKFNLTIPANSRKSKDAFFGRFPEKNLSDFAKWKRNVTSHFIWHTEQEIRNDLSNIYNITCFTESNHNNLMWTHYTNNYKGICIEYTEEIIELLSNQKGFLACSKVNYSNKPPHINIFDDLSIIVKKVFFNKQSEWKYEKEFRVILNSKDLHEYVYINPSFIKAVYIGSKCDKEIIEFIRKLCQPNKIKIFHVIALGKTYNVHFEEDCKDILLGKSFW